MKTTHDAAWLQSATTLIRISCNPEMNRRSRDHRFTSWTYYCSNIEFVSLPRKNVRRNCKRSYECGSVTASLSCAPIIPDGELLDVIRLHWPLVDALASSPVAAAWGQYLEQARLTVVGRDTRSITGAITLGSVEPAPALHQQQTV